MKYWLIYLLIVLLFLSCTEKRELGYYAHVKGNVYESESKSAIADCRIVIIDGENEVLEIQTDSNGKYFIGDNLEPFIDYLFLFIKENYQTGSVHLNLQPDELKDTNIYISRLIPEISIDEDTIFLEQNSVNKKIQIHNNGLAAANYSIRSDLVWLSFDKTTGTIGGFSSVDLTLAVNYSLLNIGSNIGAFSITVEWVDKPKIFYVKVIKAILPSVYTLSDPVVLFTSVRLWGFLESDGGLPILKRGFLISELNANPKPELNGKEVKEFPVTGTSKEFTCIVPNLSPFTEYCFRAFAVSNLGASYGDIVKFITN